MSTSFSQLKKSSGSKLLEKVRNEAEKLTTRSNGNKDDRFWQPVVDKEGNGYAVIRFLPEAQGEELPWARLFRHGFQGPGGWYIENSLTTINKDDPCGEFNNKLWNRGDDAGKAQAREQKRKLTYISNIYVVKDEQTPENEGKVFLFRYGKKIWDKLNEAMNPEFEDEEKVNPFDLWEGANFRLKIRTLDKYRNYDKSDFGNAGPLLEDDDTLETIWKSQYALAEFIDIKNFKTYDELKARLDKVLGLNADEDFKNDADELDEYDFEEPPEESPKTTKAKTKEADSEDSEEFDLSDFESMVDAAED
jgi:hypothetical protein